MGLDASVRCNCIQEGKARPHPFPGLLGFDEAGEPTLKGDRDTNLKLRLKHDKGYRDSCPHSGYLLEKRLGNTASVAYVRAFLANHSQNSYPVLLEREVSSVSDAGDWDAASHMQLLVTD